MVIATIEHLGMEVQTRNERADRLRHAVLEDFEVGLLQILDGHPVLVANDDIHQHRRDAGLRATGRAGRRLLLGMHRVRGRPDSASQRHCQYQRMKPLHRELSSQRSDGRTVFRSSVLVFELPTTDYELQRQFLSLLLRTGRGRLRTLRVGPADRLGAAPVRSCQAIQSRELFPLPLGVRRAADTLIGLCERKMDARAIWRELDRLFEVRNAAGRVARLDEGFPKRPMTRIVARRDVYRLLGPRQRLGSVALLQYS